MTPQALKASLLQRAIQGKLVEQRPEEGTAEALYTQIQTEKTALIKAGKLKKDKPLPEITADELPFDIPPTWKWVRLGEIVYYAMGKTPPRAESEWWGNYLPWISIADMPEGGHIFKTKESVSKRAITEKFSGKIVRAGTLLMSFKLTIGRVSILDIDAVHNEAIISILPYVNQTTIMRDYLFMILPCVAQSGEANSAIKGRTLNSASISNLLIPLPPLAEQQRIVEKIEMLLPLVERYEAAWERLNAFNKRFPADLQKSLLQMAIQGKLVEQRPDEGSAEALYTQIQAEKTALIKAGKLKKDKPLPEITADELPFDIPPTWKWVRWGDISYSIQYGYNAPARASGRIRIVRISDIQEGEIVWDTVPFCDIKESEIDDYLLKKNDILFARTGGTVGKSHLVKEPQDAIFAGYLIRTCYSEQLCPQYLKFFMESALYWKQLQAGTIATAQPNCNGKTLARMILPLPPLAEQKRIVERLEQLLALTQQLC